MDDQSFETASPDLKHSRRQKQPNNGSIDRLPPHSPEVEKSLLGCQLINPNECIPHVIERLGDRADEAYYDLRHQTIQKQIIAMFNARVPIDLITLQQALKDSGFLDQIGGIPYLSQAQDAVPSAANIDYYLDIVREKWLLRQMIATCTEVVGRIYDYEGEVDQLLDEVERDVLRVAETRVLSNSIPIRELVSRSIGKIEEYFDRKGTISGIPTGFPDLDRMTDGLHPAEMVVIAARPSMGKTSLAMNIVEHVAIHEKLPVGVFSLEMSSESLILRMMCSLARVNLRSIRDGFMHESDFPKLTAAAGKLSASKLFIDDTAGLSILQLRARARRLQQQHDIKLFVIDYLQLLHSSSKRADNRQQEIADISSGIKALSKELGVPVIVLSQLNRELEKRSGKPRMSDLRESGAIEQDADLVGLLYKPNANDEESPEEGDGVFVNLLIAKQRNGPTGDVNFTFLKPYTRFESAAKLCDEDLPRNPHND